MDSTKFLSEFNSFDDFDEFVNIFNYNVHTFKVTVKMAEVCEETPYKVDKVFWLICSGRFYNEEAENGEIKPIKKKFIDEVKGML